MKVILVFHETFDSGSARAWQKGAPPQPSATSGCKQPNVNPLLTILARNNVYRLHQTTWVCPFQRTPMIQSRWQNSTFSTGILTQEHLRQPTSVDHEDRHWIHCHPFQAKVICCTCQCCHVDQNRQREYLTLARMLCARLTRNTDSSVSKHSR